MKTYDLEDTGRGGYEPNYQLVESVDHRKAPDGLGEWVRREDAYDRIRALEATIRWALGEGDEDFPFRQSGEGMYWWRTELRRRAALPQLETKAEPKMCDCISLCRESNSAWKCPPGQVCKLTTDSVPNRAGVTK
jgi:hypothetical protein